MDRNDHGKALRWAAFVMAAVVVGASFVIVFGDPGPQGGTHVPLEISTAELVVTLLSLPVLYGVLFVGALVCIRLAKR